MLSARLPPLRRERNAQLSRSCKLGRGCCVRAYLLAGSVLLPTGSLASAAARVHFFFIYLAAWILLLLFSSGILTGVLLRAGLERGRGEAARSLAERSRAEPPAPGPARGSASLAQRRPRVGRGAAEWRASRRRLPAEQPGAAAAPRPGRGGSRAGGGGSEKAREDPPAPRGEEKKERREGAWM